MILKTLILFKYNKKHIKEKHHGCSRFILNRLCDLQGTNFEIVDCQVKEKEVV